MEQRRTAADFYMFMHQNYDQLSQMKMNLEFNQNALDNQMLPEAFSAYNYDKATSEIRISEHERKTQIDLNKVLKEKQEAVRLSLISKHLSDIQKVSLIQDQIDLIYHQINEIENGRIVSFNNLELSETIKQDMIDDRKDIIKDLKEVRRARQRGLREIDTGTNPQAVDEDTNLR